MKDWIIEMLYVVVIEVLFGVAFIVVDYAWWASFIAFFIGNIVLDLYVNYRKKHDDKE